jgi:hypothetical protein
MKNVSPTTGMSVATAAKTRLSLVIAWLACGDLLSHSRRECIAVSDAEFAGRPDAIGISDVELAQFDLARDGWV